jgi:DNA adenine methylase
MHAPIVSAPASSDLRLKPLLKWAGGKRQLLPEIRRFYPSEFQNYFEPFAGSAAVFFDLMNAGSLGRRGATLIDHNQDLIGCYLMVRERTDEVIDSLRELEAEYRDGRERHFYSVRDSEFNPLRHPSLVAGRWCLSRNYTPRLAAMLIYLNRTGFNGLFRLNSKGLYNVPHGRYSNPMICDEENLRAVAGALKRQNIRILNGSFDQVLEDAKAGDFIYFDPPYAPVSSTSDFTSYTAEGFGLKDQGRLQNVVVELVGNGCQVLISNSTAAEIAELYDNRSMRKLGIKAHRVAAKRAINSDPSARGNVYEYLITNVSPRN